MYLKEIQKRDSGYPDCKTRNYNSFLEHQNNAQKLESYDRLQKK